MEQRKAFMNMMSSIVLMILALVMWFYLIPKGVKLRSAFGGDVGVTSRTFPYMTALVIGSMSLLQFMISLVNYVRHFREGQSQKELQDNNIAGEVRAIIIYGLFIAFGVIFRYWGTIPAMVIVPPFILLAMGSRKILHYVSVYSFMAIMYVLFKFALHVYLP